MFDRCLHSISSMDYHCHFDCAKLVRQVVLLYELNFHVIILISLKSLYCLILLL